MCIRDSPHIARVPADDYDGHADWLLLLFSRDSRKRRLFLEEFAQRFCRRPETRYPFTAEDFVGEHPRLSAEDHSLFQVRVFTDPDLPAQYRSRSHGGTARNARLRGDHHVLTELHVVSHMHEVVDLRT